MSTLIYLVLSISTFFNSAPLMENSAPGNPVTWEFSVAHEEGNKFTLTATATIDKGWVLYSQDNSGEGPVPTTFNYSDSAQLQGETLEEGDLIKKMDPLFETMVAKYKSKTVFTQHYTSNDAKGAISGYVNFMTCDGLRCLPPKDIEFNLSL